MKRTHGHSRSYVDQVGMAKVLSVVGGMASSRPVAENGGPNPIDRHLSIRYPVDAVSGSGLRCGNSVSTRLSGNLVLARS
jgi:hypothetical protein